MLLFFYLSHVSTWNKNFSEPSNLGLEIVHSNWNNNINNNNNNNHIIQQNDPSSVQCDAMTPNVNGFNNSMEVSSKLYCYYYQKLFFPIKLFLFYYYENTYLNGVFTMIRRI